MNPPPITSRQARALAEDASEAIRTLNHATHPADGFPCLRYPSDAYLLLGAMCELATRLPQLLAQVSGFLQRQLQQDVLAINDGDHAGDPFGAVGTASHALDGGATDAAHRLAAALDAARQAIAFASYTGPDPHS